VYLYSGKTGALLRHWSGTEKGELYGKMAIGVGDLDGDGVEDVAIGAPWHRSEAGEHAGRVELRSGKTGDLLGERIGDEAGARFGWNVRRAPDPDGKGRSAFVISSLGHSTADKERAGVVDLHVWVPSSRPQGMVSRGARRNDIK
jgi:hypothetical protein